MTRPGRLEGKAAVVVGAGQTPGETIGNGRATAILFAREGARVFLVDRDVVSAEETRAMIEAEGGQALVHRADITVEEECAALAAAATSALGHIDILHNNVGIGAGDAGATTLSEEVWQRIIDTNLKGMWLTCKHVIPVMRPRQSGAIVNISSIAAIVGVPNLVAYKLSKAGVNALTQSLALANARYGVRVNAIMPGLMDTPMAVDAVALARGRSRAELAAARDAQVPLQRHMGTGWDVAYAALFLASDEARFITGALLPVDGGQAVSVG
jgi:NAD(P)-dependent dehydrogenase (short-subunit alcohol dehydrogenase family)